MCTTCKRTYGYSLFYCFLTGFTVQLMKRGTALGEQPSQIILLANMPTYWVSSKYNSCFIPEWRQVTDSTPGPPNSHKLWPHPGLSFFFFQGNNNCIQISLHTIIPSQNLVVILSLFSFKIVLSEWSKHTLFCIFLMGSNNPWPNKGTPENKSCTEY